MSTTPPYPGALVDPHSGAPMTRVEKIASEIALIDVEISTLTRKATPPQEIPALTARLDALKAKRAELNAQLLAAQKREDELADARGKADAAALKPATSTTRAPIVVAPSSTEIVERIGEPGVYDRVVTEVDENGASRRVIEKNVKKPPITKEDLYTTSDGNVYLLEELVATQGKAAPVIMRTPTRSQQVKRVVDGVLHTVLVDPQDSTNNIDMGPSEDPVTQDTSRALARQYGATAAKAEEERKKIEHERELADKVYRSELALVEALILSGDLVEAQKAFNDAKVSRETYSKNRMEEKKSALEFGEKLAENQWLRVALRPGNEGENAIRKMHEGMAKFGGDSFPVRMANSRNLSDATGFQRDAGPLSYAEFVKGAPATPPSGTTPGAPLTPPDPPSDTPPALTDAPPTKGHAIPLGGGMYWWNSEEGDSGTRMGNVFHMVSVRGDGGRDAVASPVNLYEDKTLDEARALASQWFKQDAPDASYASSLSAPEFSGDSWDRSVDLTAVARGGARVEASRMGNGPSEGSPSASATRAAEAARVAEEARLRDYMDAYARSRRGTGRPIPPGFMGPPAPPLSPPVIFPPISPPLPHSADYA